MIASESYGIRLLISLLLSPSIFLSVGNYGTRCICQVSNFSVTTSSEEHAKIIEKIINNSERNCRTNIIYFLCISNTPYIQQVGEKLSSNLH